MGDFNMVRGSPEHVALTGSIDPVEGRQIVAHYPVDAFDLAGGVPEGTVSFVGNDDAAGHRLIDFILVHAARAAKLRKVWVDAAADRFGPSAGLGGDGLRPLSRARPPTPIAGRRRVSWRRGSRIS